MNIEVGSIIRSTTSDNVYKVLRLEAHDEFGSSGLEVICLEVSEKGIHNCNVGEVLVVKHPADYKNHWVEDTSFEYWVASVRLDAGLGI